MDHEKLIEEIAEKEGVTKTQAEAAVRSQSSMTKRVFRRGLGESIRWPYFGVFKIDKYRLKKTIENNDGKGLRQLEE